MKLALFLEELGRFTIKSLEAVRSYSSKKRRLTDVTSLGEQQKGQGTGATRLLRMSRSGVRVLGFIMWPCHLLGTPSDVHSFLWLWILTEPVFWTQHRSRPSTDSTGQDRPGPGPHDADIPVGGDRSRPRTQSQWGAGVRNNKLPKETNVRSDN